MVGVGITNNELKCDGLNTQINKQTGRVSLKE